MFVRRSARVGVLPVLALSLALAGCGGDDEIEPKMPDSSSAASTSTAESPSPTEPVEPTLPPEAEGDDAAAAEAFVRHYYDYMNYAQQTGNVRGFRALGSPSCNSCDGASEFVTDIYDGGGRARGGLYTPVSVKVTGRQGVSGRVEIVYLTVVAKRTKQTITGAGQRNGTYPAGRSKLRFQLTRDRSGWSVTDWALA